MSNPLRWFRQNSKILVVFLGIGAMAIFGLGPVFDVLSRSSSYETGDQNPVVAKWKGGTLKRSDLSLLRRRHYDVLRFQQGLAQAAAAKMKQKGEDYRPLVTPVQPIEDSASTSQARIDDQLIERKLLAEKAASEGFVVSDAMIDDFLAQLAGDAGDAGFSRADLEQINIDVNQRGCSLAQVRRQLKSELLYRQMRVMASGGKPFLPNPTESMELYSKISNRIECEVIPVPVSQFVDEVTAEPSNATLRSLYNEGKNQYPDPTGEKPGFKIGRRLVAQYFVADFDTFQQNEINKLTDVQVEAEYDRLVAEENDLVMEVIPEDVEDEVVVPDEPADTKEEPKAEGQSFNIGKMKQRRVSTRLQETEGGQVVDAVETVVGSATETVQEAVVEAATVETQVTEVPATETPVKEVVETADAPVVTTESKVEGMAKETADEVSQATDAAETAAGDTKKKVMEGSSAKPDEMKAAGEAEADKTSDAKKETEDDDSIGPLLGDTPKLKKRAKPLREVADAIKRQLVGADTQKAIADAMAEASSHVSSFRGAYATWEINKEAGSDDVEPVFDFKGIAKSLNLTANETPLVDDEGLEQETLGKVLTLINVASRGGQPRPQVVRVANYIFNGFEQLEEYETNDVRDFQSQSQYVFWLSEKRDPVVPSFDECRDEVVAFSKQQSAYELAQKEAERLAGTMKDERGKKLSDLHADRAVKTGEFTWFSNRGQPAISSVIGVSNASDEFMSTAFGLTKLDTGVSPNASRDTVYVIQRISDEKPVDEVATDYIENQFFKFKKTPPQVRNTAAWYGRQMTLDWNDKFVDQMDLEYIGY